MTKVLAAVEQGNFDGNSTGGALLLTTLSMGADAQRADAGLVAVAGEDGLDWLQVAYRLDLVVFAVSTSTVEFAKRGDQG
ncbi:hypothetical protein HC928_03175 [bacterium]|nr:hypothetical protein [bacterium]